MARGVIIAVLIVIAALLVFEMPARSIEAEEADDLSRVLENQELILEKLQIMDKKLNQLKMRVRL